MGPAISRTWYIYGRDHSDKWLSAPLDSTLARENDINFHMGRFKHQLYLMALKLAHTEVSKMYLYQGWRRAKCVFEKDDILLTFSDYESLQAWETCHRSRLDTTFAANWECVKKTTWTLQFHRRSEV